ncbi:MAG: SurA N-terminal domain-containing protein [Rhizobiales bacterium]|nr:SurA N-terminal domain-containing protein [Hyphomicrobiales bacterium]NRB12991.1 SurA N-terminal domain-containing protein [Hyphomicrobiales bacterium]
MQFISKSFKLLGAVAAMVIFAQAMLISPSLAASRVVVTVDGKSINENDIKIRSSLTLISKSQKQTAKAHANIRKTVINKLIEEQVMLQAGAKAGFKPSNGEVKKRIAAIAKGAKLTVKQLEQYLLDNGSHINTMRNIQKVNQVWGNLLRKQFGSSVKISDQAIEAETKKGGKVTVYDLQQITLQMPSNSSPSKRNARVAQAKQVQAEFSKCSRIRTLTASLGRVEIKSRPATSLSALTPGQRKLVKGAKVGTISHYRILSKGIEMFAVCKKTQAYSNKARANAKNKLLQKAFANFGVSYLKKIMSNAKIIYR